MGGLKQHQPSMSIKEQISNLKNIGLIVMDEALIKRRPALEYLFRSN